MPSLICDVKNCSYNEDNYCCLAAIRVGTPEATNNIETCCESFNESSYVANNCAKEKQGTVLIECSAIHCIHNEEHRCKAMCVPITEVDSSCCHIEDTLCGAFVSE